MLENVDCWGEGRGGKGVRTPKMLDLAYLYYLIVLQAVNLRLYFSDYTVPVSIPVKGKNYDQFIVVHYSGNPKSLYENLGFGQLVCKFHQ